MDLNGLNVQCLGVYLTYDYDEFIKMNHKQRLKKLENTANWWKGRGLTLYGRAQIINLLLLPKLIYIVTMFAVPEEVIKDINRIVFKFLWRGQDRVVRTAMINSYENGGLRVLDFETLVKSVTGCLGSKCYLLVKTLAGSVTSLNCLNLLEVFFFCTVTMILRITIYQINSMLS